MYYYQRLHKKDISARTFILSAFSVAYAKPRSIGHLIQAGELLDISASTIRVAVVRLQKEGLLESVGRGIYGPGPNARNLLNRLQSWQDVLHRRRDWDGDWWMALTGILGRTDRKQLRERERALRLSGYRDTGAGFWVRPANLAESLKLHRDGLIDIGLDSDIVLSRVSEITMATTVDWSSLWSINDLHTSYTASIEALRESMDQLQDKDLHDAAVETFLIGQSIIKVIHFDPLLPAEMYNSDLFEELLSTAIAYDKLGKQTWERLQFSLERNDADADTIIEAADQ
ncbi:MAG: hypothetical protein AAF720_02270 [Pseudomonadota bacterium]